MVSSGTPYSTRVPVEELKNTVWHAEACCARGACAARRQRLATLPHAVAVPVGNSMAAPASLFAMHGMAAVSLVWQWAGGALVGYHWYGCGGRATELWRGLNDKRPT